ncbi:HPr family phosphocarrier protein [Glycocaulis sp.]|uniref:HPr family phosphocarrier protein n=1 Tax=Glycocaulis sp. TaxID=1969725 RepID=UPI003F701D91
MSTYTADVTIVNKRGLHARAAAKFVGLAREFEATVTVERDGEQADGRSIMDLLMLGAGPGTQLTLSAEGTDAEALTAALRTLVESGFGESE